MGNLFHLQKCSNKGRKRVVYHYHMSLFDYVIIDLKIKYYDLTGKCPKLFGILEAEKWHFSGEFGRIWG